MNNDTIAATKTVYDDAKPMWDKTTDLCSGTDGMRKQGTKYIPKYDNVEENTRYNYRINRTFLLEKYKETIDRYSGRPFAKPIIVENLPEGYEYLINNVDGKGMSITELAKNVLWSAIDKGVDFIIVDYPANDKGTRKTLAEDMKLRPVINQISAENMLYWEVKHVDGVPKLSMVRFKEEVPEADDMGEKIVEQIKVMTRASAETQGTGIWETWRKNDKQEWVPYESGTYTFPEIPIIPVYGNYECYFNGTPALMRLAELNIQHWMLSSDYYWNLYYCMGVWEMKGATDEEVKKGVTLGAGAVKAFTDTAAGISHKEPVGKSLEAQRQALQDIKTEMESMGAEPGMSARVNVSATGQWQNQNKANTDQEIWVREMEEKIAKTIECALMWKGVELPTDFKLNIVFDPKVNTGKDDYTHIEKMSERGVITAETQIREAQRRGILSDDIDAEEESASAKEERSQAMMIVPGYDEGGEE